MKRFITMTAAMFLAQSAYAEMNSRVAPRHVLALNDVEITALIDDVSIITGNTFVLHPDVRRTRVTVMSQAPMTTDEVFQVFLSTLRVNGFAAVPAGKGVYRIVPEQIAVGEAVRGTNGDNAFVTQVFRLDNISAVEAAQMVKPLIDSQGQVVANARSNTLILVDYASNLPRIRNVISSLDGEENSMVQTIALKNVPAREMESILGDLLRPDDNAGGTSFEVSSSRSSNAVILRGDEGSVAKAMQIAAELDATDIIQDTIRVIQLRHSDAVDMAPILERMAGALAESNTVGDAEVQSATVQVHEPSNSLVISAPPDALLALERGVESLDHRRAQVLVEAIIVDISDDTARDLGVEFLLAGTGDSTLPFLSTNFSRSAPNLLALAGALGDPDALGGSTAFADAAVESLLALEGGSFGGAGEDGNTLFGAILTAVEEDDKSRVLSKPFNMTLDNGTSSLVVGQEIPITTGEALGDNNTNPFRTVQREQVGIKLEVTPRISEDDTVRLDIYQEVSSVNLIATDLSGDFVTNTREITTSVLADDGEIIVIGGLIEEVEIFSSSKVPFLGDIPIMGALFRSEGTDIDRTNLMVFIRPTIVRDGADARAVTSRNYRFIRAQEILSREDSEATSGLDSFVKDVLGESPPN